MSKGIVTSVPTPTHKGTLSVVVGDKNAYQEGKFPVIEYENKSGETLQVDDTVEFNMTSSTLYDITKKYVATQGIVTQQKGSWVAKISSLESDNFGSNVGDECYFRLHPDENGQYPDKEAPSPANAGDTVEILIVPTKSSVFVKVIKKA